jgi:hypothetical protein
MDGEERALGNVEFLDFYYEMGIRGLIDITLETSKRDIPDTYDRLCAAFGLIGDSNEQAAATAVREANGKFDDPALEFVAPARPSLDLEGFALEIVSDFMVQPLEMRKQFF